MIELEASTLTTIHTLTVPFPANEDRTDYQVFYRIIGKNGVGYGLASDNLVVVTDTYPGKLTSLTNGEV